MRNPERINLRAHRVTGVCPAGGKMISAQFVHARLHRPRATGQPRKVGWRPPSAMKRLGFYTFRDANRPCRGTRPTAAQGLPDQSHACARAVTRWAPARQLCVLVHGGAEAVRGARMGSRRLDAAGFAEFVAQPPAFTNELARKIGRAGKQARARRKQP